MITKGKTLFFNESDGKGIIIMANKKKINFTVAQWNDFEIMPSKGLEIVFNLIDAEARDIVSQETYDEELKEQEEVAPAKPDEKVEESEKDMEDEDSKHFENDEDIDEITVDEVEELIEEPRPDSITNTLALAIAVDNYFKVIRANIQKRKSYQKLEGRMDYVPIKRFLWTTFNNLIEIDNKIITGNVKMLGDDLKLMGELHEDFLRKTKYPKLAYAEVFLTFQAEYQKIKDAAEEIIQKLTRLRMNEKKLGGIREIRKKELQEEVNTAQFDILEGEFKSLNGAYVDVVHMMAELDDRYKKDLKLLNDFEKEYREDFYALFEVKAKKYKHDLDDVLNAQAFLFDAKLWNEAKRSKAVKAHFKGSTISGQLNTKTYLKYYLHAQNEETAQGETKELFELYNKLVLSQKDNIIIVVQNPQDAMEYEAAIKSIDHSYNVKSFVDEIASVKWSIKNNVTLLIAEEQLRKIRIEKFLDLYGKNVLSTPEVIVIGNKPRSSSIAVQKLVPNGASPRVLAQNVKTMMDKKRQDGN